MSDDNEVEDVGLVELTMRYEYYIHYMDDQDRRNDRWVTEHYLKVDPEEMSRLEAEALSIKENEDKYMPNKIHHGMNEKQITYFN